ncbi:RNA recognition motif 3 in plant MEI2-like protein [Medicago truncatula]|uniref:RNA recognition motif 3 in plant MEI2-like protein n=1 Tax=Medicago truncatula TaxID=3880 RepID=A0A072TGK6_MEDTR|nr:RNA recognition motif 3 in plant MEI2-like protein [Medicago truncatula]
MTMQQRIYDLNPNAEPFYPQNLTVPTPKTQSRMVYDRKRTQIQQKTSKSTYHRVETSIPFPKTIEEAEALHITTVMIRNIPNQFRFDNLLKILDDHCFEINKNADPEDWSKYNIVYLPMDYMKHALERRMSNLGYAFVNFTTPAAAFKFYKQFNGFAWNVRQNRKICEINAAQHQGKESLIMIFSQKVFRCKNPDFLPILFSAGRDGFNRRMSGISIGIHCIVLSYPCFHSLPRIVEVVLCHDTIWGELETWV